MSSGEWQVPGDPASAESRRAEGQTRSTLDTRHAALGARRWAIILVLCAGIIGWGLLNYFLIPDRPRQWDFGALPDVPAESIYSTSQPGPAPVVPRQMAPLPEAAASRPSGVTRP